MKVRFHSSKLGIDHEFDVDGVLTCGDGTVFIDCERDGNIFTLQIHGADRQGKTIADLIIESMSQDSRSKP